MRTVGVLSLSRKEGVEIACSSRGIKLVGSRAVVIEKMAENVGKNAVQWYTAYRNSLLI